MWFLYGCACLKNGGFVEKPLAHVWPLAALSDVDGAELGTGAGVAAVFVSTSFVVTNPQKPPDYRERERRRMERLKAI